MTTDTATPWVCPTCSQRCSGIELRCPRDATLRPTGEHEIDEDTLASTSRPGSEPVKDPLINAKVGDYVVQARLGEGGMGIVYRGVQPVIQKPVAIKFLRWEVARDPQEVERLLLEARTVNAIRHRGIVDVESFGELPDGRPYLVMELLEGESIDALIKREAPLSAAETLPILEEMLDALDAAHSVGVVHRDLKPSNLFLVSARGGRYLKLLDFGLAKRAAVPGGMTPQTRVSMMVGTPEYMAPEQARGKPVGPQTDLYAVGVIAFEMLTGRLPFEADNPYQVVTAHLTQPPPRPSSLEPSIPPALDDLVLKLLAKEPEQRPASADVVRSEVVSLRRRIHTDATQLASVPDLQPATRQLPSIEKANVVQEASAPVAAPMRRTKPLRASMVAAAALVAAVAVSALLLLTRDQPRREESGPQTTPASPSSPAKQDEAEPARDEAPSAPTYAERAEPPAAPLPAAKASVPARTTPQRREPRLQGAPSRDELLDRINRLERRLEAASAEGEPNSMAVKMLGMKRTAAVAARTDAQRRSVMSDLDAWEKQFLTRPQGER